MGPLHEGSHPTNRALGLCKGDRSTWGMASAPTSSRKPRGLPTCGLFCSREGGCASETAPPCLVVGLFLCLGMLSSSALTAATSAGGGRPLEPRSLGGEGFQVPHAHLGSGRRSRRNAEHVALGGGGRVLLHLLALPPVKQKLPAQAGARARF